jgi:hypothetical protein
MYLALLFTKYNGICTLKTLTANILDCQSNTGNILIMEIRKKEEPLWKTLLLKQMIM